MKNNVSEELQMHTELLTRMATSYFSSDGFAEQTKNEKQEELTTFFEVIHEKIEKVADHAFKKGKEHQLTVEQF